MLADGVAQVADPGDRLAQFRVQLAGLGVGDELFVGHTDQLNGLQARALQDDLDRRLAVGLQVLMDAVVALGQLDVLGPGRDDLPTRPHRLLDQHAARLARRALDPVQRGLLVDQRELENALVDAALEDALLGLVLAVDAHLLVEREADQALVAGGQDREARVADVGGRPVFADLVERQAARRQAGLAVVDQTHRGERVKRVGRWLVERETHPRHLAVGDRDHERLAIGHGHRARHPEHHLGGRLLGLGRHHGRRRQGPAAEDGAHRCGRRDICDLRFRHRRRLVCFRQHASEAPHG